MCGICGILSIDHASSPTRETIDRMVTSIAHRGPDSQAIHIDGTVGFGHARLSIIDLAGGQQPLFNEDKSIVLVGNGEIYNHQELRRDLERAGHRFRTGSDNEVLIHLWEEHGQRCLEHLRGMFAFVLYDCNQNLLFGARDFFGQKPLYYSQTADRFAFASEIKALLTLPRLSRTLDTTALDQFLFYQYVPHPRTMFREIRQLPPGHCFLLDHGRLHIERYWRPEFDPAETGSEQSRLQEVEEALFDAVRSHLVSDVPVGLFLSGGIDSSLLLAIAAKIGPQPPKTFSIAFRDTEHDESPFSRMASRLFRTDHLEIAFRAENIEECLTHVAEVFDQPLADSAALPLLLLSRHASRQIKVVLTGDGGDELFGGYRKYRRAATTMARSVFSSQIAPHLFQTRRLAACRPDTFNLRRIGSRVGMLLVPPLRSSYQRQHWEGWDRHRLYRPDVAAQVNGEFDAADGPRDDHSAARDPVNVMLQLDQQNYLPDDLLLKTDYSTMAYGLEARAPLLDHRLADVAGKLPIRLKVTPQETKVALRRIAEKLLPPELAKRRKKGFSFPIGDWFRNELRTWVRHCLLESSQSVPALFQREVVERVLAEHETKRRDHSHRIYSLMTLELWYRRHFA